jgi:branched-chain amino acid transport system permease protein
MSVSQDKFARAKTALPVEAGVRKRGVAISRWAVTGVVLLATILFFVGAGDDWFTIVNNALIAAIAVLALNVLSGYTGQISLGISFFMAIGAYTAALLGGDRPAGPLGLQGLALPFIVWLPAAGIVAALTGALIGPTALRLKGFYLAIVTLALVFIGQYLFISTLRIPLVFIDQYLFINISGITGGPQGRTFPVPAIGGAAFDQQNMFLGFTLTAGQQYFLLILPVLILSVLFVSNVMRSRAGRAFRAVRDHEIGASIMGVNLFEAKMGAFLLSSFLAGIAGALFAPYSRYVTPSYWSLTLSIQCVAAVIIGGVASIRGSILGAAFVFALPRVIDYFSLLPTSGGAGTLSSGDLNAFIYGFLILVFLLFEPGGLIGLTSRFRGRMRQKVPAKEEGGDQEEITGLDRQKSV